MTAGTVICRAFLYLGAAGMAAGSWWGWHQFFRTDDGRWLMTGIGCPIMGVILISWAIFVVRDE